MDLVREALTVHDEVQPRRTSSGRTQGRLGSAAGAPGVVRAVAAEVEDDYPVLVELVTVGTCPLDGRSHALVGAVREAMTNAAKHAHVRRVYVYAEVAEAEVFA